MIKTRTPHQDFCDYEISKAHRYKRAVGGTKVEKQRQKYGFSKNDYTNKELKELLK